MRLIQFNPVLIMTPYFTVFPFLYLLTWLVKIPPFNDPENKELSQKKRRFLRQKHIIGLILVFIAIIIGILVIFVVVSSMTQDDKLSWAINYFQSLAQDLIITPLLFIGAQYMTLKMDQSKMLSKSPRLEKICKFFLEESIIEIFEHSSIHTAKIFPKAREKEANIKQIELKAFMRKSQVLDSTIVDLEYMDQTKNILKRKYQSGSTQNLNAESAVRTYDIEGLEDNNRVNISNQMSTFDFQGFGTPQSTSKPRELKQMQFSMKKLDDPNDITIASYISSSQKQLNKKSKTGSMTYLIPENLSRNNSNPSKSPKAHSSHEVDEKFEDYSYYQNSSIILPKSVIREDDDYESYLDSKDNNPQTENNPMTSNLDYEQPLEPVFPRVNSIFDRRRGQAKRSIFRKISELSEIVNAEDLRRENSDKSNYDF